MRDMHPASQAMPTGFPFLETERLLLRGWREDDFDAYAAFTADPEATQYLGGPQTRADAWRGMSALIGHWVLRGYGLWVVERKMDNAFMGRVGLWQPEGWPGMEVGWGLARQYWGQGYATEAARASLDYGFRNYPVSKLISLIRPENHPSQKVAERLGQIKAGPFALVILGHSYPVDIWEITREQWAVR